MSSHALAQTPEQFYKGKSIELAIGYPPAGSNDVYARLLARHLGKHIPGNPTIVPQNRPGAGSFLTLAYVYGVAPKDGSVIGIGAPTAPLDEKLGTQGVRFKTAELNWIGRIDSLINIVFTWHTSPVKTIADAFKTEAKLSGTGVGSTVSIYPTVMNRVLGTKFKLIMGYKGSNDAQLAVERGEVEGHSTSWTAVKVAHQDWRPDKKINILVQFSRQEASRIAGRSDRRRARAQRRGAPGAERRRQRRRDRHRVLHLAERPQGSRRNASPRLRRHHEGSGIPGRGREDPAHASAPSPAKSCKSSSPKSPRSSRTFWRRSAPPTRPSRPHARVSRRGKRRRYSITRPRARTAWRNGEAERLGYLLHRSPINRGVASHFIRFFTAENTIGCSIICRSRSNSEISKGVSRIDEVLPWNARRPRTFRRSF